MTPQLEMQTSPPDVLGRVGCEVPADCCDIELELPADEEL
jgi:hypothetical protein